MSENIEATVDPRHVCSFCGNLAQIIVAGPVPHNICEECVLISCDIILAESDESLQFRESLKLRINLTIDETKSQVKEGVRQHIENMERRVENYKEKLEIYEARFIAPVVNENKKLKARIEQLEAQNALLMRSGSRVRDAMCFTKKSYFNKKSADNAAEKYGLRVYTCPICYCWHTTSKEKIGA